MWFLIPVVIVGIIIFVVLKRKKQDSVGSSSSAEKVADKPVDTQVDTKEKAKSNEEPRLFAKCEEEYRIDEMDVTQDAAAIWDMIRESYDSGFRTHPHMPTEYFRERVYEKLATSKDEYTCRVLGENTFSYLEPSAKKLLLHEMSAAHVGQIEGGMLPLLELAKMVAKQEKMLDYDIMQLLEGLLKEKKIHLYDFTDPDWLDNPKIWEKSSYQDRAYLIRLKVFLDEPSSVHSYRDRNGQSLYDALGGVEGLEAWEVLINKYDRVSDLKGYLSCFNDDF